MDALSSFTTANFAFQQAVTAYQNAALNHGNCVKRGEELTNAYHHLKQVAASALKVQPDLNRVLAKAANDYRGCRQMTQTTPAIIEPDAERTAMAARRAAFERQAELLRKAHEIEQFRRFYLAHQAEQMRTARHLRYVAAMVAAPIIGLGVWFDLPLAFNIVPSVIALYIMREQIANYYYNLSDRVNYPDLHRSKH